MQKKYHKQVDRYMGRAEREGKKGEGGGIMKNLMHWQDKKKSLADRDLWRSTVDSVYRLAPKDDDECNKTFN